MGKNQLKLKEGRHICNNFCRIQSKEYYETKMKISGKVVEEKKDTKEQANRRVEALKHRRRIKTEEKAKVIRRFCSRGRI